MAIGLVIYFTYDAAISKLQKPATPATPGLRLGFPHRPPPAP